MMRNFFIFYGLFLIVVLSVFGVRGCKSERPPIEIFPDMDRQARFGPQGATGFFEDGRMDRPTIPGAVPFVTTEQETYPHLAPRGRFREDTYLASGRRGESYGDGIPIELTLTHMREGQELFQIFCSVCHGVSGNGGGVVANPRYNYPTISSLLQPRLMEYTDGEIFDIITNGRNTMGQYGSKIAIEDRWKVVMYVRALQRAAVGTLDDVPSANRGDLDL